MTPRVLPARPVPTAATLEFPAVSPSAAASVAAWNRTHDMAGMRARGGAVVRAIEGRRRGLVASRVLRSRPRVVVDVGCEDGWIAQAYADRVGTTVLVDVDPAMLERARARRLPGARFVVADAALPSPLPAGCADVVVLSAVLEHLARPADALASWAPTLVAGGRFVVFVPADAPILAAKRVLRATGLSRLVPGVSMDPAPGHVVAFRRATLARLLRPFGVVEEIAFDPAVLGYAAVVRVGLASGSCGRRRAPSRAAGA